MAAVYESLTGKRIVSMKLSTYYRPTLTLYLAMELYLKPCGRKRAARVPGSIAIHVDLHNGIVRSLCGKGDQKP